MPAKIDITGERFGRLVVLSAAPSRNKHTYWNCRCDCGKAVAVRTDGLTRGLSKSCGCYHQDVVLRHGMWQTPVYRIWRTMLGRCENPNAHAYDKYGGRGIKVCEGWHDFTRFYYDMGPRPSPKHSIDRIDNNGDYCYENCRWATKKEQSRNRCDNRWLTFNGETLCVAEWAERLGVNWTTIVARLKRGWTTEMALTAKKGQWHRWNNPLRSG